MDFPTTRTTSPISSLREAPLDHQPLSNSEVAITSNETATLETSTVASSTYPSLLGRSSVAFIPTKEENSLLLQRQRNQEKPGSSNSGTSSIGIAPFTQITTISAESSAQETNSEAEPPLKKTRLPLNKLGILSTIKAREIYQKFFSKRALLHQQLLGSEELSNYQPITWQTELPQLPKTSTEDNFSRERETLKSIKQCITINKNVFQQLFENIFNIPEAASNSTLAKFEGYDQILYQTREGYQRLQQFQALGKAIEQDNSLQQKESYKKLLQKTEQYSESLNQLLKIEEHVIDSWEELNDWLHQTTRELLAEEGRHEVIQSKAYLILSVYKEFITKFKKCLEHGTEVFSQELPIYHHENYSERIETLLFSLYRNAKNIFPDFLSMAQSIHSVRSFLHTLTHQEQQSKKQLLFDVITSIQEERKGTSISVITGEEISPIPLDTAPYQQSYLEGDFLQMRAVILFEQAFWLEVAGNQADAIEIKNLAENFRQRGKQLKETIMDQLTNP